MVGMQAHTIFYTKFRSKTFFFYVFCVVCIAVVAANIISSQKYNRNMYQVMQGESSAIIVYLEHIWGTPLFNLELETYPYSPELYYNLFLLYRQAGNTEKEHENLQKAQQIDPSIK